MLKFVLLASFMFLSIHSNAFSGYRDVVKTGSTLYISGQLSTTIEGKVIKGSVYNQTLNTLKVIENLINNNGFKKTNLAQCTVFLSDYKHFSEMNKAFSSFFKKTPWPTRATVGGVQLWKGLDVEISCIAHK